MSSKNETILPVRGMHCKSCEVLLEQALKDVPNITSAKAHSQQGIVRIQGTATPEEIKKAVESCGYCIGVRDDRPFITHNPSVWLSILGGMILVLGGGFFLSFLPNFSQQLAGASGFGGALLVGLAAGFSSCIALVGGMVLSVGAYWSQKHPEAGVLKKTLIHVWFNVGRIGGFAFGGAILGAVGAALQPTPFVFAGVTVLAALVMLWLGIQLTGIFPRYSKEALQKPLQKAQKNLIHHRFPVLGAIATGALTFFLPCGFTLAMQAAAAASGHPFSGALILAIFALGTTPGLMLAGVAGSFSQGKMGKIILSIVGVITIALAGYSLSGSLPLLIAFSNGKSVTQNPTTPSQNATTVDIFMTQDGSGYHPLELSVPAGSHVRWHITSTNPYTCLSYLVASKIGVSETLKSGENIIEFDAPTTPDDIHFSCGMGMSPGKIVVR